MSILWTTALAVMFLLDPEERADLAKLRAISRDADRVETDGGPSLAGKERKRARITSTTSDFDRSEGVALFEGGVVLTYGDDCVLCSDRLWAFMAGSNQLDRVVASGRVSVTNETRLGTCSMAIFRRRSGEIEMFWDGTNELARLVEQGTDASEIEGRRIRFWIDAEQVEIEGSRITTKTDANRKNI